MERNLIRGVTWRSAVLAVVLIAHGIVAAHIAFPGHAGALAPQAEPLQVVRVTLIQDVPPPPDSLPVPPLQTDAGSNRSPQRAWPTHTAMKASNIGRPDCRDTRRRPIQTAADLMWVLTTPVATQRAAERARGCGDPVSRTPHAKRTSPTQHSSGVPEAR